MIVICKTVFAYLAIFEYFRNMKEILFKEESAKIVGAIFEVHKRLGVGLLEKVYQEALAIELKHRNIPFEREKRFDVYYRDQKLDAQYIEDNCRTEGCERTYRRSQGSGS